MSGRVQGVGFRDSVRAQAQVLGLTGWVCNRNDGSVELLACGADAALEALQTWLHSGPALAEVTAVKVMAVSLEQHQNFAIR